MNLRKTVLAAIAYVIEYRPVLLKLLLPPAVVYVLIDYVSYLSASPLIGLVLTLAELVIVVIIAVVTHRVILLGPDAVSANDVRRWTNRETRFLGFSFALGLIFLLILLSQFLIIIPFSSILILGLCFWLIGRLSLVLPATAVGNRLSFREAWDATSDYQFQMIGVVFLFPLLAGIPLGLLAGVPYLHWIVAPLSVIVSVFVVAMLSVAYMVIIEQGSEPPSPPEL